MPLSPGPGGSYVRLVRSRPTKRGTLMSTLSRLNTCLAVMALLLAVVVTPAGAATTTLLAESFDNGFGVFSAQGYASTDNGGKACAAGGFRDINSGLCKVCGPGTFAPQPGASGTDCMPWSSCSSGWGSNGKGSTLADHASTPRRSVER